MDALQRHTSMNSLDSIILLSTVYKVSPASVEAVMEKAYNEVWVPLYKEGKSEQYIQDQYDKRVESRVEKLPKLVPPKHDGTPIATHNTETVENALETTKSDEPVVEHRGEIKANVGVSMAAYSAYGFMVALIATGVVVLLKYLKWLWFIL